MNLVHRWTAFERNNPFLAFTIITCFYIILALSPILALIKVIALIFPVPTKPAEFTIKEFSPHHQATCFIATHPMYEHFVMDCFKRGVD